MHYRSLTIHKNIVDREQDPGTHMIQPRGPEVRTVHGNIVHSTMYLWPKEAVYYIDFLQSCLCDESCGCHCIGMGLEVVKRS